MIKLRPSPEVEEILAEFSLRQIDVAARVLFPKDLVLAETSKAITVAQLHPDIEARVVCKTIDDAVEAMLILEGNVCRDIGGTFSVSTRTLELPNGSAVVVKFEPTPGMLDALMDGRMLRQEASGEGER
jgi:hypothetical protein